MWDLYSTQPGEPSIVKKHKHKDIISQFKPKSDRQAEYAEKIESHQITFGIGSAGTGKSYVPTALAAEYFIKGDTNKIILCRPTVTAGEDNGFLPGDIKQKLDPFMRPIYDNLRDYWMPQQVEDMIKNEEIEIAPVGFMRGRTLENAFIIVDEAQNLTEEQMIMVLTRFGPGSKMVINLDPQQCDLSQRDLVKGTGSDVVMRLETKNIKGIAFTRFTEDDVTRHPLVAEILRATK